MRLTTNKPTEEMNMYELAHNGCYVENRLARYRDFDRDIDARDFARELMVSYGLWKSCKEYGLDADNELVDDEIFDDTMLDNMQYDATTIEGLLALFYRNLWAMADLHSKLKHYEDLADEGRLIELPCKVGDTAYFVTINAEGECIIGSGKFSYSWLDYPRVVFATKAEAEEALKRMQYNE